MVSESLGGRGAGQIILSLLKQHRKKAGSDFVMAGLKGPSTWAVTHTTVTQYGHSAVCHSHLLVAHMGLMLACLLHLSVPACCSSEQPGCQPRQLHSPHEAERPSAAGLPREALLAGR